MRMIFAHLEIPYEDVRLDYSEWLKLKPGTCNSLLAVQLLSALPSLLADSPFGVIPILEFVETGKRISSSIGIARMFAEQHGESC